MSSLIKIRQFKHLKIQTLSFLFPSVLVDSLILRIHEKKNANTQCLNGFFRAENGQHIARMPDDLSEKQSKMTKTWPSKTSPLFRKFSCNFSIKHLSCINKRSMMDKINSHVLTPSFQ